MHLLPNINEKKDFADGEFVQALSFCKNNYCTDKKCVKHYNELQHSITSCFKKCPYGLVSYVCCTDNEKIVFTSLREITRFKKKNRKFADKQVYNPVLSESQILTLINKSLSDSKKQAELKLEIESFDSMAHEVKKLNSQIKENCDSIINLYAEKNDYMTLMPEEYSGLFEKVKSLYIISNMIMSRYSIYDYDKNPEVLSSGSQLKVSVHGKFLKCSKILKNYKKKNSHIVFEGETHKYINCYPSFEMIPFLILENAIKYSLDGNEITVRFIDGQNSLRVEISSVGPYCPKADIDCIFQKGYRGKNAKKTGDGSGIGLYFVKLICDLHGIGISVNSDSTTIKTIGNVPYALFTIKLVFNSVFENQNYI